MICFGSSGSESERERKRFLRRDVAPDGYFAPPSDTQDTLSEPAAGPEERVPAARESASAATRVDDWAPCLRNLKGRSPRRVASYAAGFRARASRGRARCRGRNRRADGS